MNMTGKLIFGGFSLNINVSLLAVVIMSAVIYSFTDNEVIENICLIIGWTLVLFAVGPSSFRLIWEDMKKGKPQDVDPDTTIPELKELRRLMGISKDIKVEVLPNLRNAQMRFSTLIIGQPVLDSLDGVSIKGVIAHELAHVKGKHILKMIPMIFPVIALLWGLYQFTPLGSSIFTCLALSIGLMGISIRFITWPFEYKADLIAKQYVGREAVVSCLEAMAAIRKIDITQGFYFHPSITNRIASLDWSQKTRFKKWYFEL
jgi:hypothetical protein